MFLALLLSGYFQQAGRWVKWLFLIFILPWAVPAIPTFISARWMLNGQWGLINNIIWKPLGDFGPGLADDAVAGHGLGDRLLHLEMAALLDRDLPRRPHRHPARALRGGGDRRRHAASSTSASSPSR